jgi:hypothetical protein
MVTWTHKHKPMKIHKLFVKLHYTIWKSVCGECAVNTRENKPRNCSVTLLIQRGMRTKLSSPPKENCPQKKTETFHARRKPYKLKSETLLYKSWKVNFSVWHRLCFVGEATTFCRYCWTYWEFSNTDEISISSCHDYHIFLSGRNNNICRSLFLWTRRTQTNGLRFKYATC